MATVIAPSVPGTPALPFSPRIPPLQNGDRLTRAEFERRYEAMPHVKKAELIEGVVYMPSPVSFENHGGPHADAPGRPACRVRRPLVHRRRTACGHSELAQWHGRLGGQTKGRHEGVDRLPWNRPESLNVVHDLQK